MSRKRISIVLPVDNEAAHIKAYLERLQAVLHDQEHEILVCYNCDEDTTLAALEALDNKPSTVRLVKHDSGPGVAYAMRAGIQAATGDVIVTMMADGSDPPEVIPLMAEKIRREGIDVVSGSRYMRGGSQTGGPLLKRLISRFAGLSLHWLAGIQTHDAITNFRAYRREFLQCVQIESDQGCAIGLELTIKAHLQGFRVSEVPSSWVDRSAGQSRFRLWRRLPHYCHWYWIAMAAPAFVWSLFLLMVLSALLFTPPPPQREIEQLAAILTLSVLAFSMLLAVRRLRGRLHYADAILPFVWLHPGYGQYLLGGNFLLFIGMTTLWCAAFFFLVGRCDAKIVEVRKEAISSKRFTFSFCTASVFFALLWLSLLRFPVPMEPTLDPSWQQALGHFYQRNFQAGVDYIFTYGPLGYFLTNFYNADLFWQKILWELEVKFFLVVLFIWTCWRSYSNNAVKFLYGILLVIVLPMSGDAQYKLAFLTLTAFVMQSCDQISAGALALAVQFFAVLSLAKFTFFLFATICLFSIAVALLEKRSLQTAAGFIVLSLLGLLSTWLACSQHLLNLPQFVSTSLQVAAGYSEAMARPYPDVSHFLPHIVIVCSLLAISIILTICRRPRDGTTILMSGVIAAGAFLAWKHGFVRPGPGHLIGFFAFATLAPFVLIFPLTLKRPSDMALNLAVGACSLLAVMTIMNILIKNNPSRHPTSFLLQRANLSVKSARSLGSLNDLKARNDKKITKLQERYDLPSIRSRIAQQSVDIISYQQGIILLNGFNWRPRPVFQSFVTYTPELLRTNADFFASDLAPTFIIFKLQTIDQRFPTLDDNAALRIIFRKYKPVLKENGFLLLQRDTTGENNASPASAPVLERQVRFGEAIDIGSLGDDKQYSLSLDIRPSWLGRIRKLLYKPPLTSIEVTFANGRKRRYRIIPEMVRSAFLFTPLIGVENRQEVMAWPNGADQQKIVSFRVLLNDPRQLRYFAPAIGVSLHKESF